jgi:PPM family protein phosphatase
MRLEIFKQTKIGDRKVNQDSMVHVVTKAYGLFVVADGLGGHSGGEKASQFFCRGMVKHAKHYQRRIASRHHDPLIVFGEWIGKAVEEMRVLFSGDSVGEHAHTTCAVLYVDDGITLTGYCGDSRIYRVDTEQILWRTQDHSVPQMLFQEGMITEMEIARHPGQNKLTRTLNINKVDPVDIELHPVMRDGEAFVICTDGFWSRIKQEELVQLAESDADKQKLAKLVRLCIYRGSGKSDNVSVYVLRKKKTRSLLS